LQKPLETHFLFKFVTRLPKKNFQKFSLSSEQLSVLSAHKILSLANSSIVIYNQKFPFNFSLFSCLTKDSLPFD
jgi:hypothetical protein